MQAESPPTGVGSRLYREPDDKKIAGVCAGLADHFGIDPRLVRLGAIVLALSNGLGVVAYLIAVVVIPVRPPDVPRPSKPVEPLSTHTSNALVIGLVLVAALMVGDFDLWWFDGPTFGVLLVAIGVWLLVTDRENSSISTTRSAPSTTLQGEAASQSDPSGGDDLRTTLHRSDSDDSAGPRGEVPPPVPPWGPPSFPSGFPAEPVTGPTAVLTEPPHFVPVDPSKPARAALLPAAVCGILLVCAGVSALIQLFGVAHPSPVDQVGAVLVVLGIGLVVGAWRGRARTLIGFGIPVVAALAVGEAIDFPLSAEAGDREVVVTSVADLRDLETEHELIGGQLLLDLSDAPLSEAGGALRTVDLSADVGAGEIEVILPADVTAIVDAEVNIGELRWDQRSEAGVKVDRTLRFAGREGAGTIRLDLHVGIGELHIRQEGAETNG